MMIGMDRFQRHYQSEPNPSLYCGEEDVIQAMHEHDGFHHTPRDEEGRIVSFKEADSTELGRLVGILLKHNR